MQKHLFLIEISKNLSFKVKTYGKINKLVTFLTLKGYGHFSNKSQKRLKNNVSIMATLEGTNYIVKVSNEADENKNNVMVLPTLSRNMFAPQLWSGSDQACPQLTSFWPS